MDSQATIIEQDSLTAGLPSISQGDGQIAHTISQLGTWAQKENCKASEVARQCTFKQILLNKERSFSRNLQLNKLHEAGSKLQTATNSGTPSRNGMRRDHEIYTRYIPDSSMPDRKAYEETRSAL